MDGFDDNFGENQPAAGGEPDPAAEFLAREQNELAGLEDDVPASTEAAAPTLNSDAFFDEHSAAAPTSGDDLTEFEMLGGSDPTSDSLAVNAADVSADTFGAEQLEAYPPADEMFPSEEPSNHEFDSDWLSAPTITRTLVTPSPPPVREEPEKIRIWREEQQLRLQDKDSAEEKEKAELREKAKRELEDWNKQHEEQVAKTRQANRSAEKELVADSSEMVAGTEWERITKLCDFNPKSSRSSRDVSRMRSIILKVKQNPPVKA